MLIPTRFFFLNLIASALERLIRREFEADEFLSLIERIFVWKDVDNAISSLSEGDAQSLINVMEEARNSSAHHR